MQIKSRYSHLNGEEYMLVHHPQLWTDIRAVIADVDAESCRTKVSKEKNRKGELLFSPGEMNRRFKDGFEKKGMATAENTILGNPQRKAFKQRARDVWK